MADWVNVASSTIKRVRYLPESQQLHIEFQGHGEQDGKVACYDNVTPAKYKALMDAPNLGLNRRSSTWLRCGSG